jgi:hypothetical protein
MKHPNEDAATQKDNTTKEIKITHGDAPCKAYISYRE